MVRPERGARIVSESGETWRPADPKDAVEAPRTLVVRAGKHRMKIISFPRIEEIR